MVRLSVEKLTLRAYSVKLQVRDGAERRFRGPPNRPSPESDLASTSVVEVGSSELVLDESAVFEVDPARFVEGIAVTATRTPITVFFQKSSH